MGDMTPDEWMEKADYEGGVIEALEYGLSHRDVREDPEFDEFREVIRTLVSKYENLVDTLDYVYATYGN